MAAFVAQPPPRSAHDAVVEAVTGRVLAELELRLKQKEERLWRRGQVEFKRLEQEHKEVLVHMDQIIKRQAKLQIENQALQKTVCDLTAKLQHVLKDTRTVLRLLPHPSGSEAGHGDAVLPMSPAQSAGSTTASDQALAEPTPGAASSAPWSVERPAHHGDAADAVHTPPRGASGLGYTGSRGAATGGWASAAAAASAALAAASPAAQVLSLASVLPMSGTPSRPVGSAARAGGGAASLKKLNLSECLASEEATAGRVVVNIEKEPELQELGLEVVEEDGGQLRIESIDGFGMVARHNSRQSSDALRVLEGDVIVEVNGVGRSANDMLKQCKANVVVFTLAREGEASGPTEALASAAAAAAATKTPSKLRPEAQEFVPGIGSDGGDEAVVKRLFD